MTTPAQAAADAAKASQPGMDQPPADPPEAIKPQIAHYLGLVRAIETRDTVMAEQAMRQLVTGSQEAIREILRERSRKIAA